MQNYPYAHSDFFDFGEIYYPTAIIYSYFYSSFYSSHALADLNFSVAEVTKINSETLSVGWGGSFGGGLFDSLSSYDWHARLFQPSVKTDSTVNNIFLGRWGNDSLSGGDGWGLLTGWGGNNTLSGGAGNDWLFGNWGNNTIEGGSGRDLLTGWLGNDTLNGGASSDWLFSGWGNDTAYYSIDENNNARDFYHGGSGTDTLIIEVSQGELDRLGITAADIVRYFSDDNADKYVDFSPLGFNLQATRFEAIQVNVLDGNNVPDENNAPIANADYLGVINEDQTFLFDGNILLSNDSDPDGDALILTALDSDSALGASIVNNNDGSYTYNPGNIFNSLAAGETVTDSFNYTMTDGHGGTVTGTVSITIEGVNDVPQGLDNTVYLDEDSHYVVTLDDLGYSDVDGDALNSIRIDDLYLPAGSHLSLSGVAVNAGDEISAADIAAGNLVFIPTPDANGSGSGYANFQFSVSDGVSYANTSNHFAFDVIPVNDAPEGADNTISLTEDASYVLSVSDFGYSDVDGDALASVRIDSLNLPAGSSLSLSSVAVGAGAEISAADIVAGNLVFTPAADANGLGYADIAFSVSDGVDYSSASNALTFDVTSVNDAPTGTDNTISLAEDSSYVLSINNFGYSDVDGDALASVRIDSLNLPRGSHLTLSGVAVGAGAEISAADIAAGNLVFTPAMNANGLGYADIEFSVSDGVDYSSASNALTFDVTSVNDAPEGADNTISLAEDSGHILSINDFGYSDVEGDALASVRIDSLNLPRGSSLTLSGSAVSVGAEISAADIVAGNLVFTPAADANGLGYADIAFSVSDGVDYSPASSALTFDVTSVNDAPEGTDNTISLAEDSSYVLTINDFGYSDVEGDALASVRIDSLNLPAGSSLNLSGVAVSVGAEISAADIVAGNLVFTPAINANGSGYADMAFSVSDGVDYSSASNALTFDVTSVNDAPAGTDSTISLAEDSSYVLTVNDFGYSDVEGDALTSVRIDSLNLPAGSSLTLSGSAVSVGAEISAADITAGNLVFMPAADANGSGYADIAFSVSDGVDYSSVSNVLTFDVTSVNDAPAGADSTISLAEDTSYVLTVNDFGYSDVEGDALASVRIDSLNLPAGSSLTLSGSAVSVGAEISAADITAGNLVFTPAADANGSGYADIAFSVSDGVDYSSASNALTFDVTSVNDAPAGADNTISLAEDTNYILSVRDFGYSDVEGDELASVRIDSLNLPVGSSLTLSGSAVSVGAEISAADIVAGNLVFTPAADANGSGYSDIAFSVSDGVDYSSASNALTFDVTSVNDAPAGADSTISLAEDSSYVLTVSDFGYSDVEGDALASVRIDSLNLPVGSSLTLSGSAVSVGAEISVADIAAGNLVFTPAADANGLGYADIAFSVSDGVDYSSASNALTFDVTSVNDAPAGADSTISLAEDASYVLTVNDFGYSDVEGDALTLVRIDSLNLPVGSSLTLSGSAVIVGAEISAADIVAGNLVFTPAADANGSGYADMTFSVSDGVDYSSASNALTFDVTPVNDAPVGADSTISLAEDTSYVLTVSDFGYSDVEGDALASVRIDSLNLPAGSSLTLSGSAVSVGAEISAADIAAGNLVFTPAVDANGLGYADIAFSVSDGVDYSSASNALTFDVTSVNDAPAGADSTISLAEDTSYVLTVNDFGYSDVEGDALASVRIDSLNLPAGSSLTLSGSAVSVGAEISAADIAAGNLVFTPAINANGLGYADIEFSVNDGVDYSSASNALTFDVTSVNDAPEGADNTISLAEDSSYVLTVNDFGYSDAEGDALASVRIDSLNLPVGSSLTLSGSAVSVGAEISVADIAAGNLVFTPAADANGSGYSDIAFSVSDGVDYSAASNALTFDVTPVNDAPAGADNTISLAEDSSYVLTVNDFGYSDVEGDALASVRIDSLNLPVGSSLNLSGVAVSVGAEISVADIAAGNLVFTPAADANGSGYSDIAFSVSDGVDYSSASNALTFDVTSVNDAPAGADNTISLAEDSSYVLTVSDFGYSDVEGDALVSVRIDSLNLPAGSSLSLSGVAVSVGAEISAADIVAGNLVFTPAINANGSGYSDIAFSVSDGVDYSSASNALTFDVTPVNDAPVGTDNTISLAEDSSYVLTVNDFGYSDVEGDALASVRIDSLNLPTGSSLNLSGVAVSVGAEISAADIAAGNLVFTPAADANGNGYSDIAFSVNDGVDYSSASNALTFDVTSVNDAPAGADNTISLAEDSSYVLTVNDFGYSDVEGDALASVRIDSLNLPAGSSLTLSGSAVGVGAEISAADIAAGNLVFTPAADANGNGYADIAFSVSDGVDYSSASNALTFDVTSVNDAPAGADNTISLAEDTNYILSVRDFGYSDVEGDALASVRIDSLNLPVGSSLTLSGSVVSVGAEISAADIVAGNLVFTPAADANGSGYADMTFSVSDGVDYSSASNALTFDVTSVNDAPVGADSTISLAEDSSYVLTVNDFGYSDVEGDALASVRIDSLNLPAGSSLNLSGVAVSVGAEISAADIAAGNLVFTPAINANGLGYADIEFSVNDGVDYSSASNALTFDVTSVNDAPEGADNTISLAEDTSYVLTVNDFGYSDAEGDALASVRIDSLNLPAGSSLTLSGSAVGVGAEISAADIAAGNLVFTPAADANGNGYADIAFSVSDGVDYSSASNALTFDVTSVNDAPAGADNTISLAEDTSYVLTVSDFGYSDVEGDALASVRIDSLNLPVGSSLTLSGSAVSVGAEISAADIVAGNLVFTPAADANGSGYSDIAFSVSDGVDYSAASNALTFDVTSVNDAPAGADSTISLAEDTSYVLTVNDFGYSDVEGDALASVRIDSLNLPAGSSLNLSGVAVSVGAEISAADIAAGNLVFTPAADANGNGYADIAFSVSDGVDYSSASNALTFDVTSVNDAPVGADSTISLAEDSSYVLTVSDFGYSDVEGDALASVRIDSLNLPVGSSLTLSGSAVSVGAEISVADIAAGNLVFTPAADANGSGYSDIAFSVSDGVDYSAASNALTFDVTPVNDAPAGADNTISLAEDSSYVLTVSDFGYSDVEGDALASVRIDSLNLPVGSSLTLSGSAVSVGAEISVADIAAGNLVFTPAADANGLGYADMAFSVSDGVDYSSASNALTFDVTPVNDAPVGADNTISLAEDTSYVLTVSDFGYSDVEGDALASVRIDSLNLPAGSSLTLSGSAVSVGAEISAADIAAGNLVFTPAVDANGLGYADIAFSVSDGVDYSSASNALTFDVTSVNDAPVGADSTISLAEDSSYVLTVNDFGYSDVEGDALASVRIDSLNLPAGSSLNLSGVAVSVGAEISAADIAAGNLVFTPAINANGLGYADIEFSVNDGVDYSSASNALTFDVTSVNDAPEGADNTISLAEDTSYVLTVNDFGYSDAEGDALASVRIDSLNLPAGSSLTLSGSAVGVGAEISAADIAAGNLVFTPAADANGNGYADIAFSVSDGVDYSSASNALTFDVTSVNDAPAGADNTISLVEDTSYVLTVNDFGYSDVEGDALASVRIDSLNLPVGSSLTLSGSAVSVGAEISVADIAAGNLVFTPAADANGSGYADIAFSVNDGVDYSAASNALTFDVTPVNDAPAGADNTISLAEDSSYVLTVNDFGYSDVEGDALASVRIDSLNLPVGSSLNLSGVAVSVGAEISAADIAAGNLVFTPAADANGSGYADMAFSVSDGVDYSSASNALTFDVTSVNDAPAGADNTISLAEDTSYVLTVNDFGYSDVEGDALVSVRIDSLNLPAGSSLSLSGVAVSVGAEISAADIVAGNLVFTPAINANGSGYSDIAFSVSDGVDYSSASNALTFDVTPVNDAPVGTDNTISLAEDSSYVLTVNDFGYSDVEGDALASVRIDSLNLPAGSSLSLSGVAVSIGAEISAADIVAGNLVFTPAINANGSGYSDIAFSVSDGVDYSSASNALTFDVTSVNDAPAGADNTISLAEDSSYVLTVNDFGYSDVEGDALASVRIDSLNLPAGSSLTLSGSAVGVGAEISAAGIAAGNLVFTPAADANGSGYADIAFSVSDGVDYSSVSNALTFDVTSVNDAPTGADSTISLAEDSSYVLTVNDFGYSDVEGDALASVRIDSLNLPAGSSLNLSGVAVSVGAEISAADIAAGNLVFTPAADANGLGYADIAFSVNDGVDYSSASNALTFDVTSVNDAPAGADSTISLAEDTSYVLTVNDFGYSDVDGDALASVRIDSLNLPAGSSLSLSGVAVSVGAEISAADIAAGNLVFTPAADANGLGYADIAFSVSDGVDYSSASNALTFDVTSVNDAPAGADSTISLAEDASYVLTVNDFGYSDVEGDALTLVRIDSLNLPVGSSLTLSGSAVIVGAEISAADIVAGNLVFTPAADANGSGYSDIAFSVSDGVDYSSASNALTFDVTSVNDAPAGADNTISLAEDSSYVLTVSDFGYSDVEGDALASVRIDSLNLPVGSSLTLSGSAVSVGAEISAADIVSGNLVFTPAADANGSGYADIEFSVSDGVDYSSASNALTFDVTSVNDAPAGSNKTVSLAEDTSYVLSVNDFGYSDVDGDALASVRIDSLNLPPGSRLLLSGLPVNAGTEISIADIVLGNLSLTPAAGAHGVGYASITFNVSDGALQSDIFNQMTFDVTSVNDAPAGTDNTVSLTEDNSYVLSVSDFGYSDVDGDALASVRIDSLNLPAGSSLNLSGVAVSAGAEISAADIAAGNLVFTPAADANGLGYANIAFSVSDGTAYSSTSNALTFDVTSVNDAPVGADSTISLAEDSSYVLTVNDFGYSDVEGDALVSVRIDSLNLPAGSSLTLSGSTVSVGAEISAADIVAGNLVFTPAANANGSDYADMAFSVSDGVDYSSTSNALTFDVTSVNDAPAGADNTISLAEDASYVLTVNDFGYSDVEGDALASVRIDSLNLPVGSHLTLSGVAVGAGAEISAADIVSGNLVFIPAADANGSGYADIAFSVSDGVDYSSASNALTFDVTPVNDAPEGADNTISLEEDTNYVLTVNDFGYSDVDGDALVSVRIDSLNLPVGSSLTLSGSAVSIGAEISVADIAAGNLVFTPAVDATGNAYANFEFSVNDGVVYADVPSQLTFDVMDVSNDAPVLDVSTNPQLNDLYRNIADSANTGTSISVFSGLISDSDGPGIGIAVTDINVSHGDWEYSVDGGNTWNLIVGVDDSSALLLRESDLIRFIPDNYFEGSADISFKAWDQSSGSEGQFVDTTNNDAFSLATETATVDINSLTLTSGADVFITRDATYDFFTTTDENYSETQDVIDAGVGKVDSLLLVDGGNFVFSNNIDNVERIITDNDDYDMTLTGMATGVELIDGSDISKWHSLIVSAENYVDALKILGGDGDDVLTGGLVDDEIYGDRGDDIINGGAGADELDGGSGEDTLSYINSTSIDNMTGVTVNLEMESASGVGTHAEGDTIDDFENVIGSNFNDILIGDNGENLLDGRGGNDFLNGDNGDDLLLGGEGDDVLWGGQGKDTILGGAGNDIISGGSNHDLFIFDIGDGSDTITDFSTHHREKIDLSAFDTDFASLQAAMTHSWGGTVIDLSLVGGDPGDQITLEGVNFYALDSSDFIFS
jgi:VCBS repeat-containing protein